MTEKRFNARRNEDDDFEDRFKVVLEDVLGIVETDEKTDSVELKKEYYREQSKDKHYTYLDYSKDKYIGSFFCNDVMLKTNEVVELLNENEQLKQQLFEARKDYIIETADISDKPYYDKEMEELWKEIFE